MPIQLPSGVTVLSVTVRWQSGKTPGLLHLTCVTSWFSSVRPCKCRNGNLSQTSMPSLSLFLIYYLLQYLRFSQRYLWSFKCYWMLSSCRMVKSHRIFASIVDYSSSGTSSIICLDRLSQEMKTVQQFERSVNIYQYTITLVSPKTWIIICHDVVICCYTIQSIVALLRKVQMRT